MFPSFVAQRVRVPDMCALECVHLLGSGARFRHRSGMMDPAALPSLVDAWVTQVLAPAAATRDNAGGSSGSAEIHKHTGPCRSW